MKQPKVYIKHLNKVLEVESIRFDTKGVEVYDEDESRYHYYDFEDVEFISNTGYRDKNDKYIYTGDILKYKEEANLYYINKLLVEKDGEEESYILTTNGIYVRRLMAMDDYLVIGNIYENRELLED